MSLLVPLLLHIHVSLFSNRRPWAKVDASGPFSRHAHYCKCCVSVHFGLLPSWAISNLFIIRSYSKSCLCSCSLYSLRKQPTSFPGAWAKHSLTHKAAAVFYQPCWNEVPDKGVSVFSSTGQKQSPQCKNLHLTLDQRSPYNCNESLLRAAGLLCSEKAFAIASMQQPQISLMLLFQHSEMSLRCLRSIQKF